jgi:hypothetical protein
MIAPAVEPSFISSRENILDVNRVDIVGQRITRSAIRKGKKLVEA